MAKEDSFTLDLSAPMYFFEGKELTEALEDGDLSHIREITLNGQANADCISLCMGFSEFLFNLLKECRQLSKLNLVRVSLDRLESRSFFDSLTQHPEIEKATKIERLELKYLDLSDHDLSLLGASFPNVKYLKFYLNQFSPVAYENSVAPYFETIDFENDDGWWPGCEIWGDGQITQDKNSDCHY